MSSEDSQWEKSSCSYGVDSDCVRTNKWEQASSWESADEASSWLSSPENTSQVELGIEAWDNKVSDWLSTSKNAYQVGLEVGAWDAMQLKSPQKTSCVGL